jgi:hypothetical protein
MKIRDLKKDVNYIFSHIIDECYSSLYYSPEIYQEHVISVMADALEKKNEFLNLINKTQSIENGEKKKYLSTITTDIFETSTELIDRLNDFPL